jgi:methanogenic corrinoid protein MtbC1
VSAASTIIDASSKSLAQWIVDRQAQFAPAIRARYEGTSEGEWFTDWATDTRARLSALAEALAFDAPALFENEIAWARAAFESRGVPLEDLLGNLTAMRDVLGERLPAQERTRVLAMVERGIACASGPASESVCLLAPGGAYGQTPHAGVARQFLLDMLEGNRDAACERVLQMARAGTPIPEIYRWVIEPVLIEIGRMWLVGEVSVADEHYATAATEMVMSRLHEFVNRTPWRGRTLVAAAAGGDLHAIGIRMVSDLFELHGWRSHYLGANSPGFAMLEAVENTRPQLVAISAKLTHHVRAAATAIRDIRSGEHGAKVPILVGGAPFCLDHDLARKIGADGWAANAWDAVAAGERLAAR